MNLKMDWTRRKPRAVNSILRGRMFWKWMMIESIQICWIQMIQKKISHPHKLEWQLGDNMPRVQQEKSSPPTHNFTPPSPPRVTSTMTKTTSTTHIPSNSATH